MDKDAKFEIAPVVLTGEILPPKKELKPVAKSRAAIEFSKPKLDALKPKSSAYFLSDAKVAGHYVRVAPNGQKWFHYRRRQKGEPLFRKKLLQYIDAFPDGFPQSRREVERRAARRQPPREVSDSEQASHREGRRVHT
jgi:hypothetical protein